MSGDPRTDPELLSAHVDGDDDAFGVLFARHRDRLWAVALRTVGNPEDAADGLQDGMIAAYRRADSFRGEAQVTTWLHRVVVNACLDRMRAAKVRRAEPLPEDLDEYGDRGSLTVASATTDDPADVSVRDERRAQVLAALRELPVEQRAALVLVDMEGYSVAEAADILGCAVGTVKSRCSRGRARLAGLLGHLLGDSDDGHLTPGNPDAAPPVRSEKSPRASPPGGTPADPA
ncbi:MAG: RNA polymerase sigma factor SigM [Actinomycetota bacterium]|nr:RNA polymerase sigma factor SigM [Actinomycetota bacterium]